LPGKLRMGLDWFIPPKIDGEDETLADFITRRLGAEALDKIAEPLLAGIYNAEADRQSVLATFPRFRDIEEKHGSLIRGMLAAKKMRSPQPSTNGRGPLSAFVSFRGGMGELVDKLLTQLHGALHLEAGVTGLARQENGYTLTLASGRTLSAASVILTVPAFVAADLLRASAPVVANGLQQIRYVSTGTISLAYRRDSLDHPLNGFGVVIPHSERRAINAVTWTSTKFDHRAPDSHVLLRVFFGGSRTPHMMEVNDEELVGVVRGELRAVMGIKSAPTLHRIYRWWRANPQYDVGHLDRVAAIEDELPKGVFLAGSAYRGIGVPDCVRQGGEAAEIAGQYLVALFAQFKDSQESLRV
jgi:oxygen-dependent protoporphyrinogen oxidase